MTIFVCNTIINDWHKEVFDIHFSPDSDLKTAMCFLGLTKFIKNGPWRVKLSKVFFFYSGHRQFSLLWPEWAIKVGEIGHILEKTHKLLPFKT